MKTTARPIRTTIVFGLICGLAFIPLAVGLSYVMPWSKAFCFTVWVYLAAYGFVLTSWSDKDRVSIFFPLLLALLTIFLVNSPSAFRSGSFQLDSKRYLLPAAIREKNLC